MREFYDTSVLVAVFWGDHPNHAPSLNVFAKSHPDSSCCAAHSLAEVYSVLTRLPVRPTVLPEQALLFLEQVEQRLKIVGLQPSECMTAIREAAVRGITGGRIYDALLLRCARRKRKRIISTPGTSRSSGVLLPMLPTTFVPRNSRAT